MFQLKQFPVKHPLEPWYVSGIVEGLGTFTFSRSGSDFTMYFAMKVSARDLNLLHDIRGYFGGIGRIYPLRRAPENEGLVNEPGLVKGYYFRVTRREELLAVAAHFERFPLRSIKSAQFGIWREMLDQKMQFRKPARGRLAELAADLGALRRSP